MTVKRLSKLWCCPRILWYVFHILNRASFISHNWFYMGASCYIRLVLSYQLIGIWWLWGCGFLRHRSVLVNAYVTLLTCWEGDVTFCMDTFRVWPDDGIIRNITVSPKQVAKVNNVCYVKLPFSTLMCFFNICVVGGFWGVGMGSC